MILVPFVIGFLVFKAYCHVILEPKVQYSAKHCILIIFPESEVPAAAYTTLGRTIQEASQLILWIGIIENKPNTQYEIDDVNRLVHEITKDVFSMKTTDDEIDIILGGHGQAGSLIQQYISEHPDSVNGMVLMGTHVILGKQLLSFNEPTLTVVGNLDGITKVTTLAKAYENYLAEVEEIPTLKYHYPMVVLDGVNHGIFSNGQLPIDILTQDIPTEVDTKKLQNDIAQAIAVFLLYYRNNYRKDVLEQLDGYLKDTAEMLNPLLTVQKITSSDYQSSWVKSSQLWLSELVGPESARINIESYFTYQSAFDPAVYDDDTPSKIKIYLFSQLDTPLETGDSAVNDIPSQIHARMFRRDRILQLLGVLQSGNSGNSTERTCKDLNYASYLFAYYTSPENIRQRFDSKNPGIILHDDIQMSSAEIWQEESILVKRENNVLHVTSHSYKTDTSKSGHIFCTLLPPIRAMEWIYYGIFK